MNLFNDYNFSIIWNAKAHENEDYENEQLKEHSFLNKAKINPTYMERSSIVFEDIYSKIRGKKFGNLHSNGKVLGTFLTDLKNSISLKEKT